MKVLFVTDLHGSSWKYDRLLDAAQQFGAEVVINGGDMLPMSENIFSQDEFIVDYLENHFSQFDREKIYYLFYPGNDDLKIFDPLLESVCSKYSYIINIAQRKQIIAGFEFIGMNWVVDYPFRLKDRCRVDSDNYEFQHQFGSGLLSTTDGWQEIEDWFSYARSLPTIEQELENLIRPDNMQQCIYIMHMPPANLGLDKCGHGAEVGSQAIYNFLARGQPRLSLHGHIHESPEYSGKWLARLNGTICIQPGQLAPFTYVTIDLNTMTFDRHVIDQQS